MPDHPWYKDWFNSPYYHLLYSSRDIGESTAFIDQLIEYLHPPAGARMLDVACGKGRHSIILNARGFDVTGIDLSENSIAAALPHENQRLHFYKHDMRLPFWINYFQYAFNFFTSFGYFNSDRDNQNAISTMSRALATDGVLMLDYLNVHYAENHLRHRETKQVDGVTFYLTRWLDEHFFYKKIEIEDEERLEEPLVFTERVHKFSLGDFNDMFAYEHMQIVDVFGDYTLGHYDVNRSPRLIMIAKKQAHALAHTA